MKTEEPRAPAAGLLSRPRRIFYGWWVLASSCVAGADWPVYLFILGFGFAQGSHTLNRAILGEYFGQSHYARIWGLMSMATTPLAFAGPVVAGWVFDTTGTYDSVVLAFAALLACNILFYFNCRRPKTPVGEERGRPRDGL